MTADASSAEDPAHRARDSPAGADGPVTNASPAAAKIALFRSLFRGREDVYPRRFESRKTGRSGLPTGLRQRMGPRRVREAPHQVPRMSKSALPAGHRRRGSPAPVWPGRPGPRVRHGPVSPARGRNLLFAGRRSRRRCLAGGCRGIAGDLPAAGAAGCSGTLPLRQGRPPLVVLCRGGSRQHGEESGLISSHRDHGRPPGNRPRFLRPAFSQPGHPAQRRLRQPDRAAAAEEATGRGQ